MEQPIKREDLKKKLAEKKAKKDEFEKQREQAKNKELFLQQLQINLTLEIKSIQGGIDTLEELLGVKKPQIEKGKGGQSSG